MNGSLVLTDVAVSAAERPLLSEVGLSLAPGALLALIGPSGLGKTSLLRAVAALDDWRGHITLDDRTAAQWGYPAWRRAVVLVQQRGVMLAGTVRDNLAAGFGLSVAGPPPPEDTTDTLLADLGLDRRVADQQADRISVGQAQRVSLARALLVQPRVLLLDEPTAGLDPEATRQVEAVIRRACAGGMCALIVSHDPDQPTRLGAATVDLARFRAPGSAAAAPPPEGDSATTEPRHAR